MPLRGKAGTYSICEARMDESGDLTNVWSGASHAVAPPPHPGPVLALFLFLFLVCCTSPSLPLPLLPVSPTAS